MATDSQQNQSNVRAAGWRKRLFSFGKQRKSLASVAPAAQPVPKPAVVAWERKRGAVEQREKRRTMSAPSPDEGVEEMETEMSPEPNGEWPRLGQCPWSVCVMCVFQALPLVKIVS